SGTARIEPPPPTRPSEKPTSVPENRPSPLCTRDNIMASAFPDEYVEASGRLCLDLPVPRRAREQKRHAAESGDARHRQAGADKQRHRQEPGRNQDAEQRADEGDASGADLHLALDLDGLATVDGDRKSC